MANYEMSDDQLERLVEAATPTPMIMLQCGTPTSPQERSNMVWKALGKEIGFKHMTAAPRGGDPKKFSAEPINTDESDG